MENEKIGGRTRRNQWIKTFDDRQEPIIFSTAGQFRVSACSSRWMGRRDREGEVEHTIRWYQTPGSLSRKDQGRRCKDGNLRRPKLPNLRVADPQANWIAIYIECARASRERQRWLSWGSRLNLPPALESKVRSTLCRTLSQEFRMHR